MKKILYKIRCKLIDLNNKKVDAQIDNYYFLKDLIMLIINNISSMIDNISHRGIGMTIPNIGNIKFIIFKAQNNISKIIFIIF